MGSITPRAAEGLGHAEGGAGAAEGVGSCPVPVSASQRSKCDLLCLVVVIISGLLSA